MKKTYVNPDAIDAAEVYYDDDGAPISACVHLQPGPDGQERKFTSRGGQEFDLSFLENMIILRGNEIK